MSLQEIDLDQLTNRVDLLLTKTKLLEGAAKTPDSLNEYCSSILQEAASLRPVVDHFEYEAESEGIKEKLLKRIANARRTANNFFLASQHFVASANTTSSSTPAKSSKSIMKVKNILPPVYSGDYKEYRFFWENYKVAVHNNPEYNDQERYLCFLSLLSGEPLAGAKGFNELNGGYRAAIAKFEHDFGNPTKLCQIYKEELKSLPEYSSQPFPHDRTNLIRINDIINNLKATDANFSTKEIENSVLRKFSKDVVVLGYHRLIQEHPFLDFDLSVLLKEIERNIFIEDIYKLKTGQSEEETPVPTKSTNTFVNSRKKKSSEPGQSSSSAKKKKSTGKQFNNNSSPGFSCLFCNGQHRSSDCRKFSSIESRRKLLSEAKRCMVCFSEKHTANCPEVRNCKFCKTPGHCMPLCAEYLKKVENKASNSGTFLETFMCTININNRCTTVRGLLDGASDTSYILNAVPQRLGVLASKPSCILNVMSYGSTERTPQESAQYDAVLENKLGGKKSISLLSTPCITGDSQLTPHCSLLNGILPTNQYADPSMFNPKPRQIELLIGADYYYEFVHLVGHKTIAPRLALLKTFFGWIPHGSVELPILEKQTISLTVSSSKGSLPTLKLKDMDKEEQFKSSEVTQFWDLEVLGIRPSEANNSDDLIMKLFRDQMRVENGRYVISWPWKLENFTLPSIYRVCLKRLEKVLESNPPDVLKKADEIIKTQFKDGVIELAPKRAGKVCHYLPHRPIVQGEKIRIVYDGSAGNPSLNDLIHPGPVLTKNLVSLLLGFRCKPVALTADIEKAYLQVGLDENDRDSVRFIWVKDITKSLDPSNLIIYRFTRTPFGVNASPFALNMVLLETFSDDANNPWHLIGKNSFYVDNLLCSLDNPLQAMQLFESLNEKLSTIGLNLRDWTSNSVDFRHSIPADKRTEKTSLSILGLMWDVFEDKFSFKFEEHSSRSNSMSSTLSHLQQVFDPLGFVAPCLIDLKAFMQECWKLNISWKQPLPENMEIKVKKLLSERDLILKISIPRFPWRCSPMNNSSFELHTFCDASIRAYGCAIYLAKKTKSGLNQSTLIFSKSRIAPTKKTVKKDSESSENNTTIPRLELLAVLIGVRATKFVVPHLSVPIECTTVWTDSTTVLQWLNSPKIQPQFVQNRLNEIREFPNITVRYVPTKDNPADIISRGQKASILIDNELWWSGPSWLAHERMWPFDLPDAPLFSSNSKKYMTLVTTQGPSSTLISNKFENEFSEWESFIKYTFHSLLWSIRRLSPSRWPFSLSQTRKMAEIILLQKLQKKYFAKELKQLQNGIRPNNSLNLFLHSDGLIRCKSRLQFASLDWETVHPILLPREEPVTKKPCQLTVVFINSLHRRNHHVGVSQTLTILRQKYWVVRARPLIKRIIANCLICRCWTGGPYQLPPMPPLPEVRLADVDPFLHTGVDCFGPIYVQQSTPLLPLKTYVVLFTCLVTRAIHLELLRNMSGDEFLMALIRFSTRRRLPKFMLSDNGSNFTFIQPLVGNKVKLTDPKVDNFFSSNRIAWNFIPALSPWYGGSYESMVGVTKASLHKALTVYRKEMINYTTLMTALCQVEEVVNNRPLTYVPSDELDFIALTPNHFIKLGGTNVNSTIDINVERLPSTSQNLIRGYKHVLGFVSDFREAFHHHYFTFLKSKVPHNHRHPRGSLPFLPLSGDVVLIKDQTTPRGSWPFGVVTSVDKRGGKAFVKTVVPFSSLNHPDQRVQTLEKEYTCNRLFPLELTPNESPRAFDEPLLQPRAGPSYRSF